jgi:tetratricopeptide (TPR) repeat protein
MAEEAFGKYVVNRALGSHGPVQVYEARDPQLDRRVAIKVLHPPAGPEGAGADFEERFGREARLVAALRHPHIVQVYDFAVADGEPYMVMEYLEGGTLADRLAEYARRGETMALPEVVRLLDPLADALDAAHSQGVIHGGLAPANVLFTARGQPVLTDFGLVQILGGLALTNPGGSGAAAYISPEQASGKPPGVASDLYALGAILYELTTGRPPFRAEAPAALLLQHITEPVPSPRQFNPGLPQAAQDVLLKALAKDATGRYATAHDLARAFAAAARGELLPAAGGATPAAPAPAWLKPLAGAAEVVAPLIGRQAPAVREAPRDRRALLATILGILGILLAALQFTAGAVDFVRHGVGSAVVVLPYLAVTLLCAAAALALYWGLRANTLVRRRQGLGLFALCLVAGIAWGGAVLYERWRPPNGIIIAIGDFESRASRQVDFARRIYDQIKSEINVPADQVTLQRTFQSYPDQAAARAQGAERKAALMIWGWYDDAGVSPHVEMLRLPTLGQDASPLSFLVRRASAAPPSSVTASSRLTASGSPATSHNWTVRDIAQYVRQPVTMPDFDVFVKAGPQQMTYVSTLLLGLIYYANGKPDQALAYYDKALANVQAGGDDIVGKELAYFQRATVLYGQNRLTEARADLERAIAAKPDMYEAHYNLGILYAATCDPTWQLDRAVTEAQTAARLKPDSAAAHQLLGSLYRQAGRNQEAVAELETSAQANPQDAQIQALLAGAYDDLGQAAAAAEARQRGLALAQHPPASASAARPAADPISSLLTLGDAYLAINQFDKALAEYEAAQQSAPSDPRVYRGLGNAYYWKNQFDDAAREYQHWTTLAPQDATAHLLLGMLYQEQKQPAAALPELQTAARLATCSTAEHLMLGNAYYDRGDFSQAAAAYQDATQIDPQDADAFYLLGVMQLLASEGAGSSTPQAGTAGQIALIPTAQAPSATTQQAGQAAASSGASLTAEGAAQALERAVALRPDFPQALFALGSAYMDLGQPDRAAKAWEDAIRLRPQEPSYYAAAADAYWQLKRWDAAAAAYEQALALHDDPAVRVFLGQVYAQQGRDDAAIAAYQQALKTDAGNVQAWSSLAEVYTRQGKLADAALAYQKALQNGDNSGLRSLLALIYLRQGQTGQAETEFIRVAAADPQNVTARLMLGNLAAGQDRLDQAQSQYQQVLALQPGNVDAQMGLAGLAYKRCDLSGATGAARRAASQAPGQALYQGTLGGLLEAQGRNDEAGQIYAALQAAPTTEALAHLFAGGYLTRLYYVNQDSARLEQAARELQASLDATSSAPLLASLAHTALGQVYYLQKKDLLSAGEFRAALAAAPANAEAQAWLGDLALRGGLQGGADPAAALAAYDQAVALLPAYAGQIAADNARTLAANLPVRRGLGLTRQGKTTEAAAAFDEAIQAGQALAKALPGWPTAHFTLAIAYLAHGDQAQATAEFAAAAQCDQALASAGRQVTANLAELRGQ